MKSQVPLSRFSQHERNANRGTERGRRILADSLNNYGAGRSILVDKQRRAIAGNKTLKAAQGCDRINQAIEVASDGSCLVVVQRMDLDLSDKNSSARLLSVADNRAGELGLSWEREHPDLELFEVNRASKNILKDVTQVWVRVGEYRFNVPRETYKEWFREVQQESTERGVSNAHVVCDRLGISSDEVD